LQSNVLLCALMFYWLAYTKITTSGSHYEEFVAVCGQAVSSELHWVNCLLY